jgi:transcriptional regulator with XRE-family HTH domain
VPQTDLDEEVIIGERVRALRNEWKVSAKEIEKKLDLLSGYVLCVDRGQVVPRIETIERVAAL